MIRLDKVAKVFEIGAEEVHALRGVDLSISGGELVSIVGPSGSGKSTLMNLIGCLDTPSSGHYFLDGIDVRSLNDDGLARLRNQKIGFVFQSFNLLPRQTALDNVALPLRYGGFRARERREMSEHALARVDLTD